jgi:hypothetical protein
MLTVPWLVARNPDRLSRGSSVSRSPTDRPPIGTTASSKGRGSQRAPGRRTETPSLAVFRRSPPPRHTDVPASRIGGRPNGVTRRETVADPLGELLPSLDTRRARSDLPDRAPRGDDHVGRHPQLSVAIPQLPMGSAEPGRLATPGSGILPVVPRSRAAGPADDRSPADGDDHQPGACDGRLVGIPPVRCGVDQSRSALRRGRPLPYRPFAAAAPGWPDQRICPALPDGAAVLSVSRWPPKRSSRGRARGWTRGPEQVPSPVPRTVYRFRVPARAESQVGQRLGLHGWPATLGSPRIHAVGRCRIGSLRPAVAGDVGRSDTDGRPRCGRCCRVCRTGA